MAQLNPVLKSAQDDIIESNDPERAYEFAHKYKKLDIDIHGLENIIIKSKNPKYIYKFAKDHVGSKDINVFALENAIINTNSLGHICLFANMVNDGKNISRLQDRILASKDPEFIFLFARDVKNADIHKLVNAVISTKNFHFIEKFTKINNINNDDKKRLVNIYEKFCNIVYKVFNPLKFKGQQPFVNVEGMCTFAIKYQNLGLDQEGILEDIENEIIKSRDPKYIYEFAKFVRKSNKHKLTKAMLESDDFEYMYKFYSDVNGIIDFDKMGLVSKLKEFGDPIVNHLINPESVDDSSDVDSDSKLESESESELDDEGLIIGSWDPEQIYQFALKYDGDKHNLEHAIILINNPKYIYEFALNVNGADADALANALIISKDLTYSYKFVTNVHGLDDITIQKFTDKIIESSDVKLIYRYAYNVDKLDTDDLKKLSEAMAKLGSIATICKFARDVKGAHIPVLEQQIVNSKNVSYINWFAENIIGCNIQNLENAIIKYGDSPKIYEFAKNIKKGIEISGLERRVIELGDLDIMCMFASFKDSDTEKLEKVIKNTNNKYYIDKFYDTIRRKKAIPMGWYTKYFSKSSAH
jgi:uncharacterized protein YerC